MHNYDAQVKKTNEYIYLYFINGMGYLPQMRWQPTTC